jgi:large subunit ribosomal protein L23
MVSSSTDKRVYFSDYCVLQVPIVSEKTNICAAQGQYFFIVDKNATKRSIKSAVERVFDVTVVSVQTFIRKGKNKAFRGHRARLGDKKHAIVRLASGQSIMLASGV